MILQFRKYHGTGNDFIILDNRDNNIQLSAENINFLCHRSFGIGADGLILLTYVHGFDFGMIYYNADGNESTMCGNGGRCIVSFARELGIIRNTARFLAIDGPHNAKVESDNSISLQMKEVTEIVHFQNHSILNTGSPHYVLWLENIKEIDVVREGRSLRNQIEFQPGGINVNFAERRNQQLFVRTYERGVEDETLSCGTGVTAVAIAASENNLGDFQYEINTPGGTLWVSFHKNTSCSANAVILRGPATFVFSGLITI